VVLVLASSGCALVGYPSGEGTVPVSIPANAGEDLYGDSRSIPALDPPPTRSTSAPAGARTDAGKAYEVFGRRYQILDSSDGYRERGMASWYGEAFHGRPTASGERFDMHGFSAAHRTLPLHSWIEVANLDNGRRLVLRVNDRGPFADVGERILDLSYAAARELGVVGPGLAQVEIRTLSEAEVSRLQSRF
jgi:rare lipoprotein A